MNSLIVGVDSGFRLFDSFLIPYDLFAILVLVLVTTFISFRNKEIILSLLFSFYPTFLIFDQVDLNWFSFLKITNDFTLAIIIFISILVIIYLAISNAVSNAFSDLGGAVLYEGVLLSLALVILILITVYHFIPIESFVFTGFLDMIFSEPKFLIIELSAPILFIFLATR